MSRIALYRFFDENDVLLYVGVSGRRLARRLREHAEAQDWWAEVAKGTFEIFPSREDALAAEAYAIAVERPRYNKLNGHNSPMVREVRDAEWHLHIWHGGGSSDGSIGPYPVWCRGADAPCQWPITTDLEALAVLGRVPTR